MKRRWADRAGWARVLDRDFRVVRIETPEFTGHVTRLLLSQVSEPLYKCVGGRAYCLADSGYAWLQHFPAGENYTLTTMVDQGGSVVQWYFDIVAEQGIDERGIPWFDDLYLDIVVLPTEEAALLDADELEAALQVGSISAKQYELAWRVARWLLNDIERGAMPLLAASVDYLRRYFDPSSREALS